MKNIIFVILFLFPVFAFADEIYVIENPDGSVKIHHYNPSSSDTLAETLRDSGNLGLPIKKIKESDLPSTRQDRAFWEYDPVFRKVKVDATKKALKEAENQAKEARKQALLKMTNSEYREAKDLGLVR